MVGGFLPMVDELQLLPGNVGWTGGSWDSMEWKLGRLSGEVRPWVRVQSVESTRLETIRDNMLTGQEFVQSGVVSVSRGRLHWTCAAGAPMQFRIGLMDLVGPIHYVNPPGTFHAPTNWFPRSRRAWGTTRRISVAPLRFGWDGTIVLLCREHPWYCLRERLRRMTSNDLFLTGFLQ